MAERKLPQNLEAEMNVLGCAFLTTYALEKYVKSFLQICF